MRHYIVLSVLLAAPAFPQNIEAGRTAFESRCGRCHGGDGNGGEMGPSILARLPARDDKQLVSLIHDGLPNQGMPPNAAPEPEMTNLVGFLRSIQRRRGAPVTRLKVETTTGKNLDGVVLNEGFDDLQLQTDDKHVHLLRRVRN